MRVSWFTLESLTAAIGRATVDGSVAKTIARITRAELIVIDDIGMLPAGQAAGEAFYRVVDAAYERRSIAVTSNLHPSGFDTIMPKTLATATFSAPDRRCVCHDSQLLFHGWCWRVAGIPRSVLVRLRRIEASFCSAAPRLISIPSTSPCQPWVWASSRRACRLAMISSSRCCWAGSGRSIGQRTPRARAGRECRRRGRRHRARPCDARSGRGSRPIRRPWVRGTPRWDAVCGVGSGTLGSARRRRCRRPRRRPGSVAKV